MNHDRLDDLIASLAPVTDSQIAGLAERPVVRALCLDITTTAVIERSGTQDERTGHRRRRKLRVGVVALVATVGLGATSAAVAFVVQARTGLFGGGPGTEEGSGEFIQLDAPGAAAIIDEIGSRVPLPPGHDFAEWKMLNLRRAEDGYGVVMTTSGIESSLQYVAACQWTGYWLEGYGTNDGGQMSRAQKMLDDIPTWPALVASDGGGVMEMLRRRAEGARTANPGLFMQEYQLNCGKPSGSD